MRSDGSLTAPSIRTQVILTHLRLIRYSSTVDGRGSNSQSSLVPNVFLLIYTKHKFAELPKSSACEPDIVRKQTPYTCEHPPYPFPWP